MYFKLNNSQVFSSLPFVTLNLIFWKIISSFAPYGKCCDGTLFTIFKFVSQLYFHRRWSVCSSSFSLHLFGAEHLDIAVRSRKQYIGDLSAPTNVHVCFPLFGLYCSFGAWRTTNGLQMGLKVFVRFYNPEVAELFNAFFQHSQLELF